MDSNYSKLQHHLVNLEEKLKNQSVSSADLELPNSIIVCFFKIWKLSKEYPEFNSMIYADLFYDIFSDMSEVFCDYKGMQLKPFMHGSSLTNSESDCNPALTYTCEVCDEVLQIVNNDLNFSFDLHKQTLSHKEAELTLKNLSIVSTNPNSNSGQVLAQTKTETNSKNYQHVDKNAETREEFCAICNVKIPSGINSLMEHKKGRSHKLQVKKQNSKLISLTNESKFLVSTPWIAGKTGREYCILCDVKMPNESTFNSHTAGQHHDYILEMFEGFCNVSGLTVENRTLHCSVCDVKLDNASVLKSHSEGRPHKVEIEKLKNKLQAMCSQRTKKTLKRIAILISTQSKLDWMTKTSIIVKNKNDQYCVLCKEKVLIPSRHITDNVHQARAKLQLSLLWKFLNDEKDLFCVSDLIDVGIAFVDEKGNRHCFLCDASLPFNNLQNYTSHTNSQNHITALAFQYMSLSASTI